MRTFAARSLLSRYRFLALLLGLSLFGIGCAADDQDSTDDTLGEQVDVPLYSDDVEEVEQAVIKFDDCCVSLAGFTDCRGKPNNPVCTQFTKASGSTSFYCSAKKKNVTCPKWNSYSCYNHGQAKVSSMPCCSGRAAYNGSALYCK